MEMLWEDRENRIFDRREFEPRIVQKGWERQRIMRGTVLGTMAKKHLKVYKPTLDIPERPIEALAEDENGGGGATLKDGTMLADASKSLSTFMPLYLESIRIHRVTKVSTGFGHTLLCTDMGACLSFGRGMDGQLGHGRNANNFTPTVIDSLREVFVIDVGAGLSHSCVISRPSDRFIFCMGLNTIGQCGQGNNSPRGGGLGGRGAATGARARHPPPANGQHDGRVRTGGACSSHLARLRPSNTDDLRQSGGSPALQASPSFSREAWVTTMLEGEYGVSSTEPHPMRAALATFGAFLVSGFIPLLPFLAGLPQAFTISALLTLASFFAIGAAKSRWSLSPWWRSGLETFAIGGTAAGSGWLLTVGLRVGCRPKSLRGSSRDSERQIGIPTSKPEPVAATPISNVST